MATRKTFTSQVQIMMELDLASTIPVQLPKRVRAEYSWIMSDIARFAHMPITGVVEVDIPQGTSFAEMLRMVREAIRKQEKDSDGGGNMIIGMQEDR